MASYASAESKLGISHRHDPGVKVALEVLGRIYTGALPEAGALNLTPLITPHTNLVQVMPGGMYSKIDKTEKVGFSFCRELLASLTSRRTVWVKVGLSVGSSIFTASSNEVRIKGEHIHTRTVGFRSHMLEQIRGCGELQYPAAGETELDLRILWESLALDNKLKRLIDEERKSDIVLDTVCRKLLDSNLVQGVTHFISSVDLGVMVVERKNQNSTLAGRGTSEKFRSGVEKGAVRVMVGLNRQSVESVAPSSGHIVALVDPSMSLQGMNTVVRPEHEKIIGVGLSPIWMLVHNHAETLSQVCQERLKENWRKQPVVIGSGTPLRIIVNRKWLVADVKNHRVVASENEKLASNFSIQPVGEYDERAKRFLIKFFPPDDYSNQLFVSLDSSWSDAQLCPYSIRKNNVFFMANVNDRTPANLHLLGNSEPVLIYRETSVRGRRQYMAVSENKCEDGHLGQCHGVMGTFNIFQAGLSTQFYLQNTDL